MQYRNFVWILGALGVLFGAFVVFSVERSCEAFVFFSDRTRSVCVSVADTDAKRARGLSGRDSLEEGTGMLFVFPSDTRAGMWMKDMQFSLDFVWIDSEFRVLEVTENVTPETFPKVFSPEYPIRYVLEIPAGFVEEYGIAVGDRVDFSLKK